MMRFELGLEEPDPKRAVTSASTIALSYVAGGFIPLSPYMILANAWHGLLWSAVVTLAALGVFGYMKARFTGTAPLAGRVTDNGDRWTCGGNRICDCETHRISP